MTEIKALEELRELGEKVKNLCFTGVDCDAVIELADEVEQEIAEQFMKLPVDADGVPIRPRDIIEFGKKGERLEVTHFGWTKHGDPTIVYRRPNGTLDCSCIGAECHHVKPRTLEDVLSECAEAYASGADVELGSTDAMFSKYADEIRELLGVDE